MNFKNLAEEREMILNQTSKEQFLAFVEQAKAQGKNMVPVWLEITEDQLTPVLAYQTLRRKGVPSFLYESVVGGERTSRWSFLGFSPFRTFKSGWKRSAHPTVIRDNRTQEVTVPPGDPREILAKEMAKFSMLSVPGLPPFTGGMIGNIGYDAVRLVEPNIPDTNPDDLDLPNIYLMYFDVVVAFDHVSKKIYLIHLVELDGDFQTAINHLQELHEQLLRPRFVDLVPGTPTNGVASNMTQPEFEAMVERCKEYIVAGDAFQIVVSQRFSSPLSVAPFDIYRCLRHKNPAPYLFFLDFGDWQMIGSSPEIMVNVQDRKVTVSPIAGTRPRGKTEEEDEQLVQDLLADEKELAEHTMLIDLARNDVGRVAKFNTVQVARKMYVVKYATVMHIVSDVVGELRAELSPLDALWASLPAGTLSGAPKIRAMQIIEELEPTRRGPYGGCVGFLGFDGNIETAIVIRTAVTINSMVYWQAGAGIVYDSVPEMEFAESCHKGRSILNALVMAGNNHEGSF